MELPVRKECMMEIQRIDQKSRKKIDTFILQRWFTLEMVVHGECVNLGAASGWFVNEGREIVGLITYRIVDNRMEILSLDSSKEKSGIGTMLLNEAINEAKCIGCSGIFLVTTNDNLYALKFYQKRGFDMVKLYRNAVEESRKLQPQIPSIGMDGIPIKHEIELELMF